MEDAGARCWSVGRVGVMGALEGGDRPRGRPPAHFPTTTARPLAIQPPSTVEHRNDCIRTPVSVAGPEPFLQIARRNNGAPTVSRILPRTCPSDRPFTPTSSLRYSLAALHGHYTSRSPRLFVPCLLSTPHAFPPFPDPDHLGLSLRVRHSFDRPRTRTRKRR